MHIKASYCEPYQCNWFALKLGGSWQWMMLDSPEGLQPGLLLLLLFLAFYSASLFSRDHSRFGCVLQIDLWKKIYRPDALPITHPTVSKVLKEFGAPVINMMLHFSGVWYCHPPVHRVAADAVGERFRNAARFPWRTLQISQWVFVTFLLSVSSEMLPPQTGSIQSE